MLEIMKPSISVLLLAAFATPLAQAQAETDLEGRTDLLRSIAGSKP